MSETIDEEIVRMRFDNQQFEEGVAESIGTLNALKKELNFDDTSKSVNKLNTNIGDIDVSPISTAIESIQMKFSALDVIGATILSRITNSLINSAIKLERSTIGQILTGGWNRATNIDKAKFSLEGLGVAWESISGDIDYAVSGTAYGLDAAAQAAASLYASNVKLGNSAKVVTDSITGEEKELDSMAISLRAISGVAAQTNSDYESIASIFTTVAGNGRLMTMQLNQFAGRGLNVAAALGQQLGYSESQIREMVTKGKIDFNTFSEAMFDAFGEHAVAANKTFEGALSNMKAALSRIGADFAAPIREHMVGPLNSLRLLFNSFRGITKPFAEPFNFLLNFVSKAFSKKIDNFTESITNMSNGLIDFMDSDETKNTALDILCNTLVAIKTLIEPIKRAFEDTFKILKKAEVPEGLEQTAETLNECEVEVSGFVKGLQSLLNKLRDFTNSLIQDQETMQNVYYAIRAFLEVFNTIKIVIMEVAKGVLPELFGDVKSFSQLIIRAAGYLGKFVLTMIEAAKQSGLLDKIIFGLIYAIRTAINTIKLMVFIISSIIYELNRLGVVSGIVEIFKKTFGFLISILSVFQKPLTETIENITNFIKALFSAENIRVVIDTICLSLKALFNTLKEGIKASVLGKMLENIGQIFSKLASKVVSASKSLYLFIKTIDATQLVIGSICASVLAIALAIAYAIYKFAGLEGSISGIFSSIGLTLDIFGKKRTRMQRLVEEIMYLTAALAILSACDQEKLASAAKILLTVVGAIAIFSETMGFVEKNLKTGTTASFTKIESCMLTLSASAILLSIALVNLEKIHVEDIGTKLSSLATLLILLGTTAGILGSKISSFTKGSSTLVLFAISVNILVNALNKIDVNNIDIKLFALSSIVIELSIVSGLLGSNVKRFTKGATTLILFALSVSILSSSLNNINIQDSDTKLSTISTLIIELSLVSGLLGSNVKRFTKGAMTLVLFSASIGILISAFNNINIVNVDDRLQILLTIITTLSIASGLLGSNVKQFTKGAMTLVLFSASVSILVGALNSIKLDDILKRIEVLTTVIILLGVTSGLLGAFVGQFTKGASILLLFAISVDILTKTLNKINLDNVLPRIGVLVIVVTMLSVAAGLLGKFVAQFTKGSVSLILFSLSISILIDSFNKIDTNNLLSKVLTLYMVIMYLVTASILLSKLSANVIVGSIGVLILSTAINSLVKTLNKMTGLGKSIKVLLGLTTTVSLLAVAFSFIAKPMFMGAAALAVLGIAFGIFAGACSSFNASLILLAQSLTVFSQVNILSIAGQLTALLVPLLLLAVAGTLFGVGVKLLSSSLFGVASAIYDMQGLDILQVAIGLKELGIAGVYMAIGAAGFMAASIALLAAVPALIAYASVAGMVMPIINQSLLGGVGQTLSIMTEAGNFAVQGLALGVEQSATIGYSAGYYLGDTFLKGFRASTGWHSPWKQTMAAGSDATAGLYNGVAKSSSTNMATGNLFGNLFNIGFDNANIPGHAENAVDYAAKKMADKTDKSSDEFIKKQQMAFDQMNKLLAEGTEEAAQQAGKLADVYYAAGYFDSAQLTEFNNAWKQKDQIIYDSYLNSWKLQHQQQVENDKYNTKAKAEAKESLNLYTAVPAVIEGECLDPILDYVGVFHQAGSASSQAYVDGFTEGFDPNAMKKAMFGEEIELSGLTSDSKGISSSKMIELQKNGKLDEYLKNNGYYYKDGKWYKHIAGEYDLDMGMNTDEFKIPEIPGIGDLGGNLADANSKGQSLNETIKNSIKLFERAKKLTDDKSLTGAKLLGNMQSQIDELDDWAADLGSLQNKVSGEFYAELLKEGVDSHDKVIQLMDMSETELWYANELYKQQTTKSLSYAQQLSNGLGDVTVDVDMLSDAFNKMNPQIKMTGDEIEYMRSGLSEYAYSVADAGGETELTVEQVKQMAAQFLAANPKLRAAGMTIDDVTMQIMHMSTEITTMADDIKDSLEGSMNLFEVYSQSYTKTPAEMQRALDTQIASMQVWSNDMVNLANRGVSEGVLKQLREMGIDGADVTRAFVNMTDEQLARYCEAFEEAQGKPEEFAKVMSLAMHGAKVNMEDDIDGMTAEMVLLKYQISDTIKSSISAFDEFDLKSKTSMQEMTKNLLTNLKGTSDWALNMEKLTKRGVSDGLLKKLREAGPESSKYVEAMVNATDKELKNYNKLWLMQSEEFSDILGKMLASGDEKSRQMATTISKNLEKIGDATFKTMYEVEQGLKDSISSSIDMFAEYNNDWELTPEQALANVKSQVEGIKAWSSNLQSLAGKGISDEFLQYLTDLGPSAAEKVAAINQMTSSELAETDKYVREALQLDETESKKIVEKYKQTGRFFSDGIIEGINVQAIYDAYFNAADEGASAIRKRWGIASPAKEGIEDGMYMCEGIKLGIKSGTPGTKAALRTLANDTAKEGQSNSIFSKFKQVGINMAKGIEMGLKGYSMSNAVSTVTANMLSNFASNLKIHSPSRVMADLFQYVPMGAAQGIIENANYVYDAASDMARTTIEGFTDTYKGLSSIIDFDDLDLTIRPTMDISDIVEGAKRINTMFNEGAELKARAEINATNQNGANGQGNMTFVQNNYSPKALNRIEIYRQTRNQFSSLKGMVNA